MLLAVRLIALILKNVKTIVSKEVEKVVQEMVLHTMKTVHLNVLQVKNVKITNVKIHVLILTYVILIVRKELAEIVQEMVLHTIKAVHLNVPEIRLVLIINVRPVVRTNAPHFVIAVRQLLVNQSVVLCPKLLRDVRIVSAIHNTFAVRVNLQTIPIRHYFFRVRKHFGILSKDFAGEEVENLAL
jgi:hypothetical protein